MYFPNSICYVVMLCLYFVHVMFQGNLLPTTWPGRVNQRRMRRLISITVLTFSNEKSKQEEGVQWIDLESFKKKRNEHEKVHCPWCDAAFPAGGPDLEIHVEQHLAQVDFCFCFCCCCLILFMFFLLCGAASGSGKHFVV